MHTGTNVHLAASKRKHTHQHILMYTRAFTHTHTHTHTHKTLHPYWSDEAAATSSFTSPAEVTMGFAKTASLSDST